MNFRSLKRKRILFISLVVGCAACVVGFVAVENDYFFKINKSIDVFGRVYREVTMNYVDEIDPEKFMESGIDGMLESLDPYTNFISENEADEVELITSGKYGGIGVTIGLRDGFITVLSVMDGYSAQRQGLLAGDRILEIDGKPVPGKKSEDVRSMTRGEPGSELKIRVEREGALKPLDFVLVREEIQLKNLSFAQYVGDGIGYFHIERFTRGAGDELRLAIKDLRLKGTMKGIILDLRDNPGGLLDVAVDVVEKFAPKGSLVVSTRGRRPETEKKYFATEEPMVPDLPLVVLMNRNSASASEIVAGAIQDLDRGVILGTRSFGKGLVQTISPLPYNAQLKMTTAKYYTPSGRCIQEIDYQHKGKDGLFAITPDSLRQEFKTAKGRKEFEAGGITPDTNVASEEQSSVNKELLRKSMYFKFATRYAAAHKDSTITMSDEELVKNFKTFIADQKFTFQDDGELKLNELNDIADKSHYSKVVMDEIGNLRTRLETEKANSIDRNKSEVLRGLKMEIMSRYGGETARIEASIDGDVQLQAAKNLLLNQKRYKKMLGGK
jgi:carboxyl-terminal processing protease